MGGGRGRVGVEAGGQVAGDFGFQINVFLIDA